MILYYSLGGGLGHLARTQGILEEIHEAPCSFRVLSSSKHISVVRQSFPCTVDSVPVVKSRGELVRFLDSYLAKYSIKKVVLDTFPHGLFGEWAGLREDLPRLLVARNLDWPLYRQRLKESTNRWPDSVLSIEPLFNDYQKILEKYSKVDFLKEAIITVKNASDKKYGDKSIAVVHSGDLREQKKLRDKGERLLKERGMSLDSIRFINPQTGIYPFAPYASRFQTIISGCGYNSAALSRAFPGVEFILIPFKRKFDNQFYRLECLKKGKWLNGSNGAALAARWIIKHI